MENIRVVIADDHPLMVDAVQSKLSLDDGIVVVGTATSYDRVIDLCAQESADVALCDLHMPGGGPDGLARLVDRVGNTRVVVLSGDDSPAVVRGAFEAGVAGFLNKSLLADELPRHVRTAAEGGLAVDAHIGGVLAARAVEEVGKPKLSPQELEVLQLIANGATNPEISETMHVAVSTVKTYIARVFSKLDVADRAAAVAVAKDLGLL